MKNKRVAITKVVSRNIIWDTWSGFQNLVGRNLTSYEKMVDNGMEQIDVELKERKIKLAWFRYEITQLTNGAIVIMMYGEKE